MSDPSAVLGVARAMFTARPDDARTHRLLYAACCLYEELQRPGEVAGDLQQLASSEALDPNLGRLLRDHPDALVSAAAWARGDAPVGDALAMLEDAPSVEHLAAGFAYAEHLSQDTLGSLLSSPERVVQAAALSSPGLPADVVLGFLRQRPGNDLIVPVVAALRREDVAPAVTGAADFSLLFQLVAAASPSVGVDQVRAVLDVLESLPSTLSRGLVKRVSQMVHLRPDLPGDVVARAAAMCLGASSHWEHPPEWVATRGNCGRTEASEALEVLVSLLGHDLPARPGMTGRDDVPVLSSSVLEDVALQLWDTVGVLDRPTQALTRVLRLEDPPPTLVGAVVTHLRALPATDGSADTLLDSVTGTLNPVAWMRGYPELLAAVHRSRGLTPAWREWQEKLSPGEFDAFTAAYLAEAVAHPSGVDGHCWGRLHAVKPLTAKEVAQLPLLHLGTLGTDADPSLAGLVFEAFPQLLEGDLEQVAHMVRVLATAASSAVPACDAVAAAYAT